MSALKFVLDAHLGGLAARLRMLGFDVSWENDPGDDELLRISLEERRILLSRDRGLLKRIPPGGAYRVDAARTHEQLREVVEVFGLLGRMKPFTRCTKCNGELREASREQVAHKLQDETARVFDEFYECPGCERVYWKGSHYERMQELIRDLSCGTSPRYEV